MLGTVQGAQWVTQASAGIVNVELGYQPDAAILISSYDETNPDIYIWFNAGTLDLWPDADTVLKITGSTGVVTKVDTAIGTYAGGDVVASDETVDTAGKHVTPDGTAAAAGHITSPGLTIQAVAQTGGDENMLICFRRAG